MKEMPIPKKGNILLMKEEWSLYTLFWETMLCSLSYEETADPKTLRKVNLVTPSPDIWGFPGDSDSKESAWDAGNLGSIPGSGRSPWRREWQPTEAFLSGEFLKQRSLVGYSPRGHKESDITEQLTWTWSGDTAGG